MATHKFTKILTKLPALCLMAVVAVSCTYDYFEDENNFRIHVPQIEYNEISNFYIAFHDLNGKHVMTRQIAAPFSKDELTQQGILRFKLPPGEYRATCFADYTPDYITVGNHFNDSYKGEVPHRSAQNLYQSVSPNPRALFTDVTALPFGMPDGKIPVEINIDETRCFKGKVITIFNELPDQITHIDIFYKGLASKYQFDGVFGLYTANDRLFGAFDAFRSGGVVSHQDIVYPSAGVNFGAKSHIDNGNPLELEIHYYQGNTIVGSTSFTTADFNALPNDKKPTDAEGNPLTSLVLYPQKTIIFTFTGFQLFSIKLSDWGEIIPGEPTPM